MRHHLGEFRPVPDLIGPVLRALEGNGDPSPARALLPRLLRILAQCDHAPERVLEELLDASSSAGAGFLDAGPRRLLLELAQLREELRRLPDLLAAPGLAAADRRWTRALYEELACCGARRAGMRLFECAHVPGPAGHVLVAGMNHASVHEVRPGDAICGGFVAIRRAGGRLRIQPRIYRLLCASGLVVRDAIGEYELEHHGAVGAAVAHCFSGVLLEKCARRLRAAARTPLADLRALLAPIEERELVLRIEVEWRRGAEQSLFAALNAITAVARAEPDFARRLELERLAGDLCDQVALVPPRQRAARGSQPVGPELRLGI